MKFCYHNQCWMMKKIEIPRTDALKEKEGVQIYIQNVEFSKAHFIQLYELIYDSLKSDKRTEKEKS